MPRKCLRFGLRIHVITRDTEAQAWADAERLIAGLDDATIAAGQQRLQALESVGQQRMNALHGGSRENLVVAANLWAGTQALEARPMKDRDIFDLLGFD